MSPEQVAKSGTEHSLQSALFCWTHLLENQEKYPEIHSRLLFAVPNGGSRGDTSKSRAIQGGKLAAEGVKKGVPDIFFSVARGGWFGFYIEMKKKDEKPTKEQLDFKKLVEEEGYLWAYYDCWEKTRDALVWYVGLAKTKIYQ